MVRPLFAAALLFASQARAYDFKRDSTGERVKWAAPAMFYADIQLEAALQSPGARAALAEAMKRLSQAAPGLSLSLTDGEGGRVGYDFSGKNRSDVVALDAWSFESDAVAVTVVTVDTRTHAIVDADIAFNLHSRKWAVMGERPDGSRYDVQNTFTHELGHAVGLAHSQVSEAVMFGKTHPGETHKRHFETDDTEALSQLYPQLTALPPEEMAAAQGCSSTATGPAALSLLGLFALARRRALKAATLALALALPLGAEASEDSLARADKVVKVAMVGKVKKATTLPPQEGAAVLKTELVVQVKECLSTPCPATVKLYVPGGRWGNYEQRVGGMDTPKEGATVGLSRDAHSDAYVRLETLKNEGERDAFLRAQVGRAVTAAK